MTFRILARQMEALGRQTEALFRKRLSDYLRSSFPGFVARVGEEHLEDWVGRAMAMAHRAKIETEPEVAQLVLILTVLGLDEQPWLIEILGDRALLPVGKLSKIVDEARARGQALDEVIVYERYRRPLSEEPLA